MKYAFLLWLGFVILTPYAEATDMTVFGIPLAEKLTIPECEKETIGSSIGYKSYKVYPETMPCFERIFWTAGKVKDSDPVLNEIVNIRFPSSECSLAMGPTCTLWSSIIEGKLESVSFSTIGLSTTEYILSVLKQKYGKPTSVTSSKVQNRMGAKFDKLTAIWNLPDLYVHFDNIAISLDEGGVEIQTKKAREDGERKMKEAPKEKRPL